MGDQGKEPQEPPQQQLESEANTGEGEEGGQPEWALPRPAKPREPPRRVGLGEGRPCQIGKSEGEELPVEGPLSLEQCIVEADKR